MLVDLFDFELPEDRIALRPAHPRDSARMLVVRPGDAEEFADRRVRDLPEFLRAGDVLVVNDTRVIPARLSGIRARGDSVAHIEATLHKREGADRWRAFVRPAKRLAVGDRIRFGETSESMACLLAALDAEVEEKGEGGEVLLRFAFAGAALDEAIDRLGEMPLPPYIAAKRPQDDADRRDYQTLFARHEGSVAAPTAGLHFTPELVAALKERGVGLEKVTLHVGAGTFLPVKADDTADHRMHAEYGEVDEATAGRLEAARRAGGRIVAVGTTSLRLLESAAAEDGTIRPFRAETSIFITPGYRFRAVDVLMTNFHLPRSTLFMLVCAFAGFSRMKRAYAHAIASGYRFYSYGDACLLFRAPPETEPAA
ncbi:tRNA preQ1(34) S-adenosylmethionine ribosyltransferase-isomerase QueA [Alsobacter sp. SYSU M60028]|uniref:S-adenosylmethionine:tRNA ribosyltransferase-isomerase n=1 Tax=Alsobacter ponti TaxID=2962936 RepID=A0ABT1LGV0_9HYPH|nr:tRNA preQ1(34) S-adenosylmethionine ribosyltransferase-isomerase QueA [Alsobacter ponti]MCP8940732.1 tRNA preQ1(34) S-adenosylmethionine ribosyltransferase-isomerase QueA [Alsobacter ponti]